MSGGVNQITSCEVCGSTDLLPVLDLGLHPMCDDLVEVNDQRVCKEFPIEILYCKNCRTAHQKYQVPKLELFPSNYHYRSRFTADVLNGMKGLVASHEERFGSLEGKVVLDIGCNDGSLLDFFKESGAQTYGIEPTNACLDAKAKGHQALQEYLTPDVAKKFVDLFGQPDVITFTNVFAHIENLTDVLNALSKLMKDETVLVIENHYLGAILESNQFDTFYHEHPRSYSYTSFVHIANNMNKQLIDVEFSSRYGGNIRVYIGGHVAEVGTLPEDIQAKEEQFTERFATMKVGIEQWVRNKGAEIADLVEKHGPLRAKAFPGRAAILVKLLNLDTSKIKQVHEKPGSLKVGHYLPGTRIPIVSDDALFLTSDDSSPIINLAWHIPTEIKNYLAQNSISAPVVDILSSTDFS